MPQAPELAPEVWLPDPAPNVYITERGFSASLARKGTAEPGYGLYPRDGTKALTDVEAAISQLTVPEQSLNVAVSSGMAAVFGAVTFALSSQGEKRGQPPQFVHSQELYTQSTKLFRHLGYMGVRTRSFDAGDEEAVDHLVKGKAPEVIFAETVSNSADIPVLNVQNLLKRVRAKKKDQPIVVLDNTLPLSTGMDFNKILKPDDPVLVVESVTKGGMHNSGHLGVIYSKNEKLMDRVRKFRATTGIVTSTGVDASILEALEATTPGFHDRNRALYASTGKIAVALSQAQQVLGSDSKFTVSFPTFHEHPNHDYASKRLPEGGSPVVFMSSKAFDPASAKRMLKRISQHTRVREQMKAGQIYLGQSFGFKEARLLYDPNASQIRIAGGYGIDSEALASALFDAALEV
jgi:cystathionine beta-lyase/cystathionine gamma-synthase